MLIIYAHPNKDGHCGYILEQVKKNLGEQKTDFSVLDLYEVNFNPVLQPGEHYTSGHKKIAEDTKKMQEIIKKEDKMIIIYPTWWNGTPAILKGFFDRVLVGGFAYRFVNGIPRGLLKGKRASVITTTGGPVFYEKFLEGDRSLKVVVKNTLAFCGIKAKGYMIGSANKQDVTEKSKRVIEKKVRKAVKWIN